MKHIFFALSLSILATQATVIEINGQADLDAKLKQHPNAVVKFARPGCPHCETIKNDYARVSNNLSKLAFFNIDTAVQANKTVFPKWGVRGVPMIFFMKNGVKTEYKRSRDFAGQFESSVKKHFA